MEPQKCITRAQNPTIIRFLSLNFLNFFSLIKFQATTLFGMDNCIFIWNVIWGIDPFCIQCILKQRVSLLQSACNNNTSEIFMKGYRSENVSLCAWN